MRILITGIGGALGNKIASIAKTTNFDIYGFTTKPNLVNDKISLVTLDNKLTIERELFRIRPDAIIHCAAITNVDYCENDKKSATLVNFEFTKYLTDISSSLGIKLVFISSDYIFDGLAGPYSEGSIPNPINFYGLTKLQSEMYILEKMENYIIVRTTIVYDEILKYPSFVKWVIDNLQEEKRINLFVDQFGTPSSTNLIASNIINLLKINYSGVINLAHDEYLSRYDMGIILAQKLNLNENLIIPSKTIDQVAQRPRHGGFILNRAFENNCEITTFTYDLSIIKRSL